MSILPLALWPLLRLTNQTRLAGFIAAVVVFLVIINVSDQSIQQAAAQQAKDLGSKPDFGSGTWKVGKDIPAGEYLVFARSGSGYWSINTDSSGS